MTVFRCWFQRLMSIFNGSPIVSVYFTASFFYRGLRKKKINKNKWLMFWLHNCLISYDRTASVKSAVMSDI